MAVYFMRFGTAGPIKIGHALEPYKRRHDFQIASADPIEVLAVVDGGRTEEQAFHKLFSHLHIRGELFRPAADLLEYIQLMPKHEKPEPKTRGRPQVNFEQIPARFPSGTRERIEAVLEEKEPVAEFIREAVERELKRREKRS